MRTSSNRAKNHLSALQQQKAHRRIIILTFFFMLWLGVLAIRLFQLQVLEHSQLKTKVIQQTQVQESILPRRGTIYDRTGDILVRSLPAKSVFYSPDEDEPLSVHLKKIKKLQEVLGLSARKYQELKQRIEDSASFTWIKRKISTEEEKILNQLSLGGVYFIEENKRNYPHGKLAAHLLGRVNIDNEGISGIEYKYNSVLAGKEGKRLIMLDSRQREFREEILKVHTDGKDIILTIDQTIQYTAEKELEAAVRKHKASWGTVIISKPSTGEILAMANYPTWDLNQPLHVPERVDRNKAIHYNYEPGSTFKIVSASAVLEARKVRLNDSFDCSRGYIDVAGKPIRDHQRFGILSFPEIIIHSSNVGTVQFSLNLDKKTFYRMMKAFGFGQKTGIDLPAEETGTLRPPDNWTRRSLSALSIGYEISVTPIQMLQALNIIANEGVLIPPRIVERIPDSDSRPHKFIPTRRIISKNTASNLNTILQRAVKEGTGISAQIKGYKVAGKTGTSQKFEPATGTYSSNSHIVSFTGFVPADNPAFSMIVVIDEPGDVYYAGDVAAPVFSAIGSKVLQYLHILPQKDLLKSIIADSRWRRTGR